MIVPFSLPHSPLAVATALVSAVLFVSTLLALPWMCVRLPADYFVHPGRYRKATVLHSVAGALLVLVGIAMLVLPGQGILTILLGLSLLEFPGKRRAELWLVSRPRVLGALNALRARYDKPPLELPAAR